ATEDEMPTLQPSAAAAALGAVLAWVKLFSGLDQQLRTSSYGQLPLELAVVEAVSAPAEARRTEGSSAQPSTRATPPVRPAAQPSVPASVPTQSKSAPTHGAAPSPSPEPVGAAP